MKYFLHSTDSFDDEKVTELFLKFGFEGLGLFYTVLEKIGKQEKPVKTSVLKAQLKVGKRLDKCWSFMEEIGIISSNNGETFNERILSYSETYQIKKEKTREKVSQWREKQSIEKNVTSYVPVSNPPKVKESKVKESNTENTEPAPSEITDDHSLKNSNLFRKPTIPLFDDVHLKFIQKGGTKEMAEKFYQKHEGMGWYVHGSPIQNVSALISLYISNWRGNEKQNGNSKHQSKSERSAAEAEDLIAGIRERNAGLSTGESYTSG